MKTLLVILLFAVSVQAQKLEDVKDWKLIKEMSGTVPNYPAYTVQVYAAQIARSDSGVKLILKAELPQGAPRELFKANVPRDVDPSSINRVVGKLEFNCGTLVVRPTSGSAEIYQFNGKKYKSKEQPFAIESGHIFSQYFCERATAPTGVAPSLKAKP